MSNKYVDISKDVAQQAYQKPKQRIENINGYQLDKSASTKNITVYNNPTSKHTFIGYRGTNPTNINDLRADAYIALGKEGSSRRFTKSLQKTEAIKEKYKGDRITLTGHSLGGAIGQYVSKKTEVDKAITYNTGYSPLSIKRDIKERVGLYTNPNSLKSKAIKSNELRNIYGDPISSPSVLSPVKKSFKVPSYLNPHGLQNF